MPAVFRLVLMLRMTALVSAAPFSTALFGSGFLRSGFLRSGLCSPLVLVGFAACSASVREFPSGAGLVCGPWFLAGARDSGSEVSGLPGSLSWPIRRGPLIRWGGRIFGCGRWRCCCRSLDPAGFGSGFRGRMCLRGIVSLSSSSGICVQDRLSPHWRKDLGFAGVLWCSGVDA